MNNNIGEIAIFAFGAAVGAAITWKYARAKYEKIAQEEIDSAKEAFNIEKMDRWKLLEDVDRAMTAEMEKKKKEQEKERHDYTNVVQSFNYNKPGEPDDIEDDDDDPVKYDRPYVISPDEFGELDDYTRISLSYFADGVVCEDNMDVVDDIDSTIGQDSLMTFGKYEDDCVFVRNDRLRCDYEILMDSREYGQIMEEKPYLNKDW